MEDRQQFIDGLTQLRANAGLDPWIVEQDKTWFLVKSVVDDGPDAFIAETLSEHVADFIATTHAIIPELVEVIGAALDEADRLDAEKDGLIAQIFDLEVQADYQAALVDELREDIGGLEAEVDDLNVQLNSIEGENSDLKDDIASLNERISELEADLWVANA